MESRTQRLLQALLDALATIIINNLHFVTSKPGRLSCPGACPRDQKRIIALLEELVEAEKARQERDSQRERQKDRQYWLRLGVTIVIGVVGWLIAIIAIQVAIVSIIVHLITWWLGQ